MWERGGGRGRKEEEGKAGMSGKVEGKEEVEGGGMEEGGRGREREGEGGERRREGRQEVEEEERLGRKEENVGKRRRQNPIKLQMESVLSQEALANSL